MSWEKVKIGELFYDKVGRLCKKYSLTEYNLEPKVYMNNLYIVKGSNRYDFGGFYKEPNKKEYVTVHFPQRGDARVLNIYRTREAALLGALADKNAGKQGHIAELDIEVKG